MCFSGLCNSGDAFGLHPVRPAANVPEHWCPSCRLRTATTGVRPVAYVSEHWCPSCRLCIGTLVSVLSPMYRYTGVSAVGYVPQLLMSVLPPMYRNIGVRSVVFVSEHWCPSCRLGIGTLVSVLLPMYRNIGVRPVAYVAEPLVSGLSPLYRNHYYSSCRVRTATIGVRPVAYALEPLVCGCAFACMVVVFGGGGCGGVLLTMVVMCVRV